MDEKQYTEAHKKFLEALAIIPDGTGSLFESFALEGDHAVLYSFVVLKPGTIEEDYHISLGSYETTNKVAHELGEIGPNDRLFHLDGYYPDGSHRTFGMFRNGPAYETARDKVGEILKNKVKPSSGFTQDSTQPAGGEDKAPEGRMSPSTSRC